MLGWWICVRMAISCINLIVSAFDIPLFNCLTATSCLPSSARSSIPLYTTVFTDVLTWVRNLFGIVSAKERCFWNDRLYVLFRDSQNLCTVHPACDCFRHCFVFITFFYLDLLFNFFCFLYSLFFCLFGFLRDFWLQQNERIDIRVYKWMEFLLFSHVSPLWLAEQLWSFFHKCHSVILGS